jgi:hypothetical protein
MASLMKHRNGMTLIQIANMNERFMRGDFEIIDGKYWMRDLVL